MKRWAHLLAILLLIASVFTAYRTYPEHKWWMRIGYVHLWHAANWITGNTFPVPDRFK